MYDEDLNCSQCENRQYCPMYRVMQNSNQIKSFKQKIDDLSLKFYDGKISNQFDLISEIEQTFSHKELVYLAFHDIDETFHKAIEEIKTEEALSNLYQ